MDADPNSAPVSGTERRRPHPAPVARFVLMGLILLGVLIGYFFEDCEDGSEKGRKRKATKSLRPDQINAENDA